MYPPEDNHPLADVRINDSIEHKLMPGFAMAIEGIRSCVTDSYRPEPHMKYKITDPDGNTDWLCAYDVRKAV